MRTGGSILGLFLCLTYSAIALPLNTYASADTGHETGGGDAWSLEFVSLGKSLVLLMQNSTAFEGISLNANDFEKVVNETKVESTDQPLSLNGVSKTALNFPAEKRIIFNRLLWNSIRDQKLRVSLVLHEYMGIMQLEGPEYNISAKVPALLGLLNPSDFVPTLPGSSPSRNAKRFAANDDGSVSIVEPSFSVGGESLWISYYDSTPRGICRLFGFTDFVESSQLYEGDYNRTVVIGSEGRFVNYRDGGSISRNRNPRIYSIACSNPTPFVPPSVHYESKSFNDDGSVSIVEPSFNVGGESRWISYYESTPRGVCRLFGFTDYVQSSQLYEGDYNRTAVLGSEGRFSKYRDGGSFSNTNRNPRIKSIACSNPTPFVPPSVHYKSKNINDDGSVSIVEPYFNLMGGESRWISYYDSYPKGVCRLFGFTDYVQSSQLYEGDYNRNVVIGSTGRFVEYRDGGSLSNNRNPRIFSIICR